MGTLPFHSGSQGGQFVIGDRWIRRGSGRIYLGLSERRQLGGGLVAPVILERLKLFVRGWLDLMFRGSDIRGHSPYCLAKAYTPGANLEFEWRQTNGDIADPGEYDVEVRVCVAEQVGSRRACQQVQSAGTASEPGILIRALTTSGVSE